MREARLLAISCDSRIRCINAYLKWSGLSLSIPKLREESKVLPTYNRPEVPPDLAHLTASDCVRKRGILVSFLVVETGAKPHSDGRSPRSIHRSHG